MLVSMLLVEQQGSKCEEFVTMLQGMTPRDAKIFMDTHAIWAKVDAGETLFFPPGNIAWVITTSSDALSLASFVPVLSRTLYRELSDDVKNDLKAPILDFVENAKKPPWSLHKSQVVAFLNGSD